MKAKIDKKFEVEQDIQTVWKFISDPHKVVTCVPGAQITEQIDDRNYVGTVSLQVGPVKTSYKGEVTIARLEDDKYEMEIIGKGTDTKGKGNAGMVLIGTLSKNDRGLTEVLNSMEVSVSGKLAQFGSRMIVDVTDQVFGQFIDNVKNQLKAIEEAQKASGEGQAFVPPPAQEAKPLKALPLLFSIILGYIMRLFGRKPKS